MKYSINKAAVVGAGVMGISIAAHFIGAGIPVLLLDIVPRALNEEEEKKGLTMESPEFRNRIAAGAKKHFTDMKAGYCYDKKMYDYLSIGNTEDDLDKLQDCDIVVEAVIERLDIKQSLFANLCKHVRKDTILASNTSGLLINKIAEGIPEEWRPNFVGMHFFNPVRYMKLVEIIPGKMTDPQLVADLKDFSTNRIGKDVVIAKDYPNFIGSRLGTVTCASALKLGEKLGYSVPEIDAMTGEIIARPKAGTCRLLDLVGIDIFYHVSGNVRDNTDDEYERTCNTPPAYVKDMVERKQLGDKVGYGFYKTIREGGTKQKFYYDYKTGEFVPFARVDRSVLKELMAEKNPAVRVKKAVWGEAPENVFIWNVVKEMLLYAANNQEKMAHSIPEVDLAMRSGYNWLMGPYQIWEAIGVKESVERMIAEGDQVPAWVTERLAQGKTAFYEGEDGATGFIDIHDPKYPVVWQSAGGVLRDLGDGVLNLEFTTPACSLNDDLNEALMASVDILEQNGQYVGMILGHTQKNFCVGGQLQLLIDNIKNGDFAKQETVSRNFQKVVMRVKYAKKPIVACVRGKALGGGAELAMHCTKRVLHVESVMGLPEPRIGLLPAGGGLKELMLSTLNGMDGTRTGERVNRLKKVFDFLASGKFCMNAYESIANGLADEHDPICMNELGLIDMAKKEILHMVDLGFRPRIKREIKVTGTSGLGLLKYQVDYKRSSHIFTDYDAKIFSYISAALSGGEVVPDAMVSEEWLLELEIRGFLALAHEPKTLERLETMLTTKKPLKN